MKTFRYFQKQLRGGVLQKSCSQKICKIHRKTPVPESLFNNVAGLSLRLHYKPGSGTGVFR